MRFLAAVLTLQHQTRKPLTLAEWPQLREDISNAFFPAQDSRHNLLTVACLRSEPEQTILRLTLAEEHQEQNSMLSHILHCIHTEQPIHFCQRRSRVSSFDISDPVWTGISSWTDLQKPPFHPSFRLAFVTPLLTALPLETKLPDALPFPEPEIIFLPAFEYWQELAGPPFPWSEAHIIQAARCVLANYRFYTTEILSASHPILGYRGWVEYSCLQPQAEEVVALAALSRLTFFTGCGYETALGFGTVRAIQRKQEA